MQIQIQTFLILRNYHIQYIKILDTKRAKEGKRTCFMIVVKNNYLLIIVIKLSCVRGAGPSKVHVKVFVPQAPRKLYIGTLIAEKHNIQC